MPEPRPRHDDQDAKYVVLQYMNSLTSKEQCHEKQSSWLV
jgi:hypothetical protein